MPVVTRKTNATAHPSRIVTQSQQTKRTKEQIQANNAKAKQATIAKQEKAAADCHAIVRGIKELEYAEELGEMDEHTHAHRPDLFHPPINSQQTNEERVSEDDDDNDQERVLEDDDDNDQG